MRMTRPIRKDLGRKGAGDGAVMVYSDGRFGRDVARGRRLQWARPLARRVRWIRLRRRTAAKVEEGKRAMSMIDSVVARAAFAAPERIAVREWEAGRDFSYGWLDAAVSAFAAWLQSIGCAPGESVAIHLPNCAEFLIAQFGASRGGGVAAYVNYRLSADEVARQIKLVGARVLVTTAEKAVSLRDNADLRHLAFVIKDGAEPLGKPIDDIIAAGGRPLAIEGREDCDAIARFTSGSTGLPKGVLVSHRAWLIRATTMLAEHMQVAPYSSTLALGSPLSHAAGLVVIPTFLRLGTVILMDSFHIDKVAPVLASERIFFLKMVPTIMHGILENATAREALRQAGIGRLFYGGSPARPEIIEEMLALLPQTEITQSYGSHEGGSISFLDGAGHRDAVLRQSVGRPFLAVEVRLAKAEGAELGEIQVKSPWLPHARITETGREALDGAWAATGDLGEMKDGYLFLRDRLNDVIISGGFNVYPLEIENVLNLHPNVQVSAIVSAPDDKWGERVVAFVVPRDGAAFDEQALRDHCRKAMAGYKVPKEIRVVAEMPVNATGKLDRRRLSEGFWAGKSRRIN